jgi:hypothetical protein
MRQGRCQPGGMLGGVNNYQDSPLVGQLLEQLVV